VKRHGSKELNAVFHCMSGGYHLYLKAPLTITAGKKQSNTGHKNKIKAFYLSLPYLYKILSQD